jgi:C1A family cysteine protease
MRAVAVLGVLALLCTANHVCALSELGQEYLLKREFESFKQKYQKSYATPEEEKYRFDVFRQTLERVVRKNKEMDPVFGITKFSDLTPLEFRESYLSYRPRGIDSSRKVSQPSSKLATTDFDWRDHGAITPVKDQGFCGSCWAFSTTETIESAWFLAGNDLTEFSVAQIVQCDTTDYGCRGGDTTTAYAYVEDAGGLATEADYPYSKTLYQGLTGTCQKFTVSGGSISAFTYATTPCYGVCKNQDEDTLATNVAATQPASICVDASSWSDYTGGVMTSSSCSSSYNSLDHCVQLVGFSNYEKATGYWIVRNSWADDWGEDGYIYLRVGDNTCGVADEATFVTIA